MELRVLLEEALPRMKNLRLGEGASMTGVSGITVTLGQLPFEWDPT